MNLDDKCSKADCGRERDSFIHRETAKQCKCSEPWASEHHRFEEESMAKTATKAVTRITSLDEALEAAGVEVPKLPGIRLELTIDIPADVVNEAKGTDDSWMSSDPIESLLEEIESSQYPALEATITNASEL